MKHAQKLMLAAETFSYLTPVHVWSGSLAALPIAVVVMTPEIGVIATHAATPAQGDVAAARWTNGRFRHSRPGNKGHTMI